MHIIINSANRNNYLIKKAKPLNNRLSKVQWLNDCAGPWDGGRCWRCVLSSLLYSFCSGHKGFWLFLKLMRAFLPKGLLPRPETLCPDRWLAVSCHSSLFVSPSIWGELPAPPLYKTAIFSHIPWYFLLILLLQYFSLYYLSPDMLFN